MGNKLFIITEYYLHLYILYKSCQIKILAIRFSSRIDADEFGVKYLSFIIVL